MSEEVTPEPMTPEQQAEYDTYTPEKKALIDQMMIEAARLRAMPAEQKVEILFERVAELIQGFYITQQAVRELQEAHNSNTQILNLVVSILNGQRADAPKPVVEGPTGPTPMGQYL